MTIIDEQIAEARENAVRIRRAELKTLVEQYKNQYSMSRPIAAMTVLLDRMARVEIDNEYARAAEGALRDSLKKLLERLGPSGE